MSALLSSIPHAMKDAKRWGLWRMEPRKKGEKPTKIPYSTSGRRASSSRLQDWSTFDDACAVLATGEFSGLGFAFGRNDGLVGIDLDDCRDSKTGVISEWAIDIINQVGSYAEVSPSGTGVKIFTAGRLPMPPDSTGKGGKEFQDGSIEFYQHGRYFAVTGEHVGEEPLPFVYNQSAVDAVFTDVHGKPANFTRCLNALDQLPDSLEGGNGSNALFLACCEIARYGFEGRQSISLATWYNDHKCYPPWSEDELRRKIIEARKSVVAKGEWGAEVESSKDDDKWKTATKGFHTFRAGNRNVDFLVKGVIARQDRMIIGGPEKCLKTSILCDLCVSLASGTPFLGQFEVTRPMRVMMLSGESGEATLIRTLDRIWARDTSGVTEDMEENLRIGMSLPQLSNAEHLATLEKDLKTLEIEFLAIDPLYLCMFSGTNNGAEASNMFSMGPLLQEIGRVADAAGVTVCLCHHTRKRDAGHFDPLGLTDLAYSGMHLWAAQWLLLNHRQKREKGVCKLWLTIGGRNGQGREWAVDVDEGDCPDDVDERIWEVECVRRDEMSGAEEPDEEEDDRTSIQAFLRPLDKPMSANLIADATGIPIKRVKEVLGKMIKHDEVGFEHVRNGSVEKLTYILKEESCDSES